MDREERLKDWYIRYGLILKKRYTQKQKARFLDSLKKDLLSLGYEAKEEVFKFHEKDKMEYRNLYIGNLKKADKIICTYYDTPAVHLGPYAFFDLEQREKDTVRWSGTAAAVYLAAGLLFTYFAAIPLWEAQGVKSAVSVLLAVLYMVYFYFLNQITRGWPSKHTLIRNTSSVLVLLDFLQGSSPKENTAFAFLDAGCTNNAGLERLERRTRGKIYFLDSVGSKVPLRETVHPSSSEGDAKPITCLISAREENGRFFLNQEDLKQKEWNEKNMQSAYEKLESWTGRRKK